MTSRRLLFSIFALAGSVLSANPLLADTLCPGNTIKMVVQFGAGASIDVATRAVAASMEKRIGQQIIVVNMPGANGQIAAQYVHDAASDFCTLGSFSSAPFAMLPAEKKSKGEDLPYDSVSGFSQIGRTFETTFVLVVNKQFSARSMDAFVPHAKKHPLEVKIGVSYPLADVTLELLHSHFGIKVSPIPYRKGDVSSLPDLTADRIQGAILTLGAALPRIEAGELHPLFVIAKTRHPHLPEVLTADELGITELDGVRTWLGMLGPRGLPAEKIEIFNKALGATLAEPEIVAALERLGMKPDPSSSRELHEQIKKQVPAWEDLVKRNIVKFQ